jgi:hypothetical protein
MLSRHGKANNVSIILMTMMVSRAGIPSYGGQGTGDPPQADDGPVQVGGNGVTGFRSAYLVVTGILV